MNQNRPIYETQLFAAAILLAIFLRFLSLGQAPLSESEASWALQALEAARPSGLTSQVAIGPQSAYIFLTALLFRLFGDTNFMARFFPALAGVALVFIPLLMREKIGRRAAVIAAFGLAFDPGLVAVARQAGGPMLALGCGLAALALWFNRRPLLAGILAGIALLSGPAIFHGLLSLGLGGFAAWGMWRHSRGSPAIFVAAPAAEAEPGYSPRLKTLLAGALTILVLGTCFLRYPQGLAAWINSLVVYFSGWATPSGTGAIKTIAALIIYQPIALLFAILGIIRWAIQKSPPKTAPTYLALSWFGASLILILAYPARQVSGLVWALTPLWLMAAWELENYLPARLPRQSSDLPAWLHAGLVLILSGLFFYTLVSTAGIPAEGVISPQVTRLALLLGILSLGALTSILVALGWSADASRLGTAWGILAAGSIYMASVLWGAVFLRPNSPLELWGNPPGSGQVELMSNTVDTLSKWNAGLANSLEVVSLVDSPALRWVLRDYPQARFINSLAESEQPATVLTRVDQTNSRWAAAYRGQDFVWWAYPGWEGALPDDLVDWLAFREAPLQSEKIILWARSDLFPGGFVTTEQSGSNSP